MIHMLCLSMLQRLLDLPARFMLGTATNGFLLSLLNLPKRPGVEMGRRLTIKSQAGGKTRPFTGERTANSASQPGGTSARRNTRAPCPPCSI